MKELSIEEKAKAYDEALERAKKILEFYKHPAYSEVYAYAKEDIPGIFPELIENEDKDEKMRKNCIHFLELQKSHHAATFEIEECIAWLEKQKEPEDKGEISDGYHTFNELYRYRMLYNAAFFNLLPKEIVHKSKRHHDGEECFGGGWFIMMANLPTGQISNHYELKDWDLFQIPEKEVADEWDGHTPQEAAERLHEYLFKTWNEQIPTFPFEQKHFKQSECEMDEIVRKELIDAINGLWNDDALPMPLSVKRKNAWLAWLEKQGEKMSVVDFKANDRYASKVDGKIYNAEFMEKPTNLTRKLEIENAAMSATGIIERQEWFIKGAEWSDEHPSCFQIKNLAWSEDDERMLEGAISAVSAADYFTFDDKQEIKYWLKSLKERFGCEVNCTTKKELKPSDEQNPSWSDEDEEIQHALISTVERLTNCPTKWYFWLKSLKDRVQPQQKQELSEKIAIGNIGQLSD